MTGRDGRMHGSAGSLATMPRRNRIDYARAIQHVVSRGVLRMPIYIHDDNRRLFLGLLTDTVGRFGWRCHGYCLMANHFHLVVETPQPNLARGMHLLNTAYARTFNKSAGRSGHLFESRYWSTPVEQEVHLLETARYVALNPVRAGACRDPEQWPWSSHRHVIADDEPPSFLAVDRTLGCFSDDPGTARRLYAAFVDAGRPLRSSV